MGYLEFTVIILFSERKVYLCVQSKVQNPAKMNQRDQRHRLGINSQDCKFFFTVSLVYPNTHSHMHQHALDEPITYVLATCIVHMVFNGKCVKRKTMVASCSYLRLR